MSSKMLLLLLIYGIPTLVKANLFQPQPQQSSSSSSEYREGHFDNYRPKFFIPRGNPTYKDDGGQWELSYFIKNGHFPIKSKLESILKRTNQLKRLKFFKSVLDGQPDSSLLPDFSNEKKKTTSISYPSVRLPTSAELVSSISNSEEDQNEIENDSGPIQMTPSENQNQNHREIEKSFMRFYSKMNGKSDSDSTSTAAGVINLNDLPDSSSRESDAREQFEYDEPKIFSDYNRPSQLHSQSSIENYQSDQSQSVIRSSNENERDSKTNEPSPRESQKSFGKILMSPKYQQYTITSPFSSIKNLRDVRFRGLSKKQITRNIRTKSEKPVVKQTRKNNFETQGW